MKGWMYILFSSDGSYYTGSTNHWELRLAQHQRQEGANHPRIWLPVELVTLKSILAFKRHSTGGSRYKDRVERKRRP